MGITRQERTRQIEVTYIACRGSLDRLAAGLGIGPDCAEDALQDFFLHWVEMPVRSRSQPGKKTVRAWAKCGVRRARFAELRRQATSRVAEEDDAASRLTSTGQTPLDELVASEDEQRGHALLAAIGAIVEEHGTERMCLGTDLRLQGLTIPQIAVELGVSAETVKLDLRKVRTILQEELPRLGWSIP